MRFTGRGRSLLKESAPSAQLQRLAEEAAAQIGLGRTPAVCVLPGIDIPLQIGLHKLVVLLPEHTCDSGDRALRHILLHEFTHCKRRDVLYKWLVQLLVCVHWFNPLVYPLRHQISADCELSCDAAVLRLLQEEEHVAYGDMLLSTASGIGRRRLPAGSVMLSGDARALKRRLVQIAGYGKRAKPLTLLSATTATELLICGFVAGPPLNRQAPPQTPQRSPQQQMLGLNDPREIAEDFAIYELYGLTHHLEYNRLYFNGELVRYF